MSLEDPNFSCNTTIAGNTDVAGPGVIGSFAVVAWFTVILAFIPAGKETKETYQEWRNPREPSPTCRGNGSPGLNDSETAPVERGTPQNMNRYAPPRGLPVRSYTIPGVVGTQTTSAAEATSNYQRIGPKMKGNDSKKAYDYVKSLCASPKQESPFVKKVLNVLGSFGDLQAITSLGIIISGIVNRNDLTFYHQQLVVTSYMMALNSFLATRINYMNVDSDDNKWRLLVRRGAIFASVVLAIYYQIFVHLREEEWDLWPDPDSIPDNSTAGYCYRFMDQSSSDSFYFWIIGQSLFAFALALCLLPCTWRWNEEWLIWTTVITLYLWGETRASWDRFSKSEERSSLTAPPTTFNHASAILRVLFHGTMVILWFLLLQLLAIWSYGDGFYPLTWFCYLAFLVWNTFDLISLVAVNYPMVEGNELTTWGFGQVLPVVVAFMFIIYSCIDEFTGASEKEEKRVEKKRASVGA